MVGIALEQHAAVLRVDEDGVRRGDRRLVFVARRVFLLRDRGCGLGWLRLRRSKGERAEGDEQGRCRQEPSDCVMPKDHHQRSLAGARVRDMAAWTAAM